MNGTCRLLCFQLREIVLLHSFTSRSIFLSPNPAGSSMSQTSLKGSDLGSRNKSAEKTQHSWYIAARGGKRPHHVVEENASLCVVLSRTLHRNAAGVASKQGFPLFRRRMCIHATVYTFCANTWTASTSPGAVCTYSG